MQSASMRASAAGVVPSKRNTSTGVVLRGTDQAEAVVVLDAHAVDGDDLARTRELRFGAQAADDRGRLAFGARARSAPAS